MSGDAFVRPAAWKVSDDAGIKAPAHGLASSLQGEDFKKEAWVREVGGRGGVWCHVVLDNTEKRLGKGETTGSRVNRGC